MVDLLLVTSAGKRQGQDLPVIIPGQAFIENIQELCRTCPECQKERTHPIVKAPLQPLPCVGTPFQKVAFDIVGPLARTNTGFRYLLMCMCYCTKSFTLTIVGLVLAWWQHTWVLVRVSSLPCIQFCKGELAVTCTTGGSVF